MLIVSFGAFQMVIGCCMAAMVAWFTYLVAANSDAVAAGAMGDAFAKLGGLAGGGSMVLFIEQAGKWLSIGAILGIPVSFLFGVIDDKFGTPVACLVMGLTELLPPIGLMTQAHAVATTGSCNVPMLVVWGFGVACMTGGVPTMHPASLWPQGISVGKPYHHGNSADPLLLWRQHDDGFDPSRQGYARLVDCSGLCCHRYFVRASHVQNEGCQCR